MKTRAALFSAPAAAALVGLSGCIAFPAGGPAPVAYRVEMASGRAAGDPPGEWREAEPATVPVFLFADNLHTGLIVGLPWLKRHGYRPPRGTPERAWVTFSWGDETAYVRHRWLDPGQVVRALFTPTDSVMEIITFDWFITEVCPHQRIYQSFVPDSAGAPLAAFLNRVSVADAEGFPETVAPSSWGDGHLIRSKYAYYFPRICNVWTVEALNAAGFDFSRTRGLSADGVIRQADTEENGFRKIWDPIWREDGEGEEG